MKKWIDLEPERLTDRQTMHDYMKEVFNLPDYFGRNLDALHDCLSEVDEDYVIYLSHDAVKKVCEIPYAYRTLLVLSDACEENSHLHITFHKPENA